METESQGSVSPSGLSSMGLPSRSGNGPASSGGRRTTGSLSSFLGLRAAPLHRPSRWVRRGPSRGTGPGRVCGLYCSASRPARTTGPASRRRRPGHRLPPLGLHPPNRRESGAEGPRPSPVKNARRSSSIKLVQTPPSPTRAQRRRVDTGDGRTPGPHAPNPTHSSLRGTAVGSDFSAGALRSTLESARVREAQGGEGGCKEVGDRPATPRAINSHPTVARKDTWASHGAGTIRETDISVTELRRYRVTS